MQTFFVDLVLHWQVNPQTMAAAASYAMVKTTTKNIKNILFPSAAAHVSKSFKNHTEICPPI